MHKWLKLCILDCLCLYLDLTLVLTNGFLATSLMFQCRSLLLYKMGIGNTLNLRGSLKGLYVINSFKAFSAVLGIETAQ